MVISVHGNSDTRPLNTVEDISLNTLDGLGSLNSLKNLVPSSLDKSPDFLPLTLYFKNKAETDKAYQPPPSYPSSSTSSSNTVEASEADNIRNNIFYKANVMTLYLYDSNILHSWSHSFILESVSSRRKVKRFPGKSNKHPDPQPDQRLVTGRFSPDSRPVPRTPNLVLDNNNNNNNNSHLELEVGINQQ